MANNISWSKCFNIATRLYRMGPTSWTVQDLRICATCVVESKCLEGKSEINIPNSGEVKMARTRLVDKVLLLGWGMVEIGSSGICLFPQLYFSTFDRYLRLEGGKWNGEQPCFYLLFLASGRWCSPTFTLCFVAAMYTSFYTLPASSTATNFFL